MAKEIATTVAPLLLLVVCLLCAPAKADELRLLDIDYFALEAEKIEHYRDPYMPQHTDGWSYGAGAYFDLCFACYGDFELFMTNYVPMRATEGQVRYVGWKYDVGLTLWPGKATLAWRHFSEHVLEDEPQPYADEQYNSGNRFPIYDSIVLRMIFFERK